MPTKTKKKKVAIYNRVSTVEQSEKEFSSLDGQKNQCNSWLDMKNAGSENNYKVFKIYTDTKSGKNLNRPGMKQLRKDAANGKFDLMITTKLDRISRKLSDFLELVEELDEHNVDIAVTTQNIDTSTPAGKLSQNIMVMFAEFEREMNAARTREKRKETAKQGHWLGGYPPLGYDVIDKKLHINDEEKELVQEIFTRYLKSKSSTKVAKTLNKDGYRNKEWETKKGKMMGGSKFHKKVILRVLQSKLYIGKIEHDGESYEGVHDAIIKDETFEKAQEIIEENTSQAKANTTSESPAVLKDLVGCGFCDSSFTITSTKPRDKKYHYYRCVKKNNEGKTKDHAPKDLSVPSLDEFVLHCVKFLLREPELLEAMKKRATFESKTELESTERKINRLTDNLKTAKKDISNTLKLLTNNPDGPSAELYQDQLDDLKLEQERIEDELEHCKKRKEAIENRKVVDDDTYKVILNEFIKLWDESESRMREDLMKTVIKSLVSHVDNDKTGDIEINFLADKKLEAEWQEIKKCEPGKVQVRTSGMPGSPGRIRTYDPSVNSRLLCR